MHCHFSQHPGDTGRMVDWGTIFCGQHTMYILQCIEEQREVTEKGSHTVLEHYNTSRSHHGRYQWYQVGCKPHTELYSQATKFMQDYAKVNLNHTR